MKPRVHSIGICLEWAESPTLNTNLPNVVTLTRVEESWWMESWWYPVWIKWIATKKVLNFASPVPQIRVFLKYSYEPAKFPFNKVGCLEGAHGTPVHFIQSAVHPSKVTTKYLRTWSVSMPRWHTQPIRCCLLFVCVDLFADLRGGELFPLGASFDVILVISLFKQYFRTLVYMSVVACFFPSRLLHMVLRNMNVRMLYLHLHTKKTWFGSVNSAMPQAWSGGQCLRKTFPMELGT